MYVEAPSYLSSYQPHLLRLSAQLSAAVTTQDMREGFLKTLNMQQHDMGLPTHSVGIYQLIIPYNDSKDLSVFPLASTLRMRKKEPCHLPADHCATAPRKKNRPRPCKNVERPRASCYCFAARRQGSQLYHQKCAKLHFLHFDSTGNIVMAKTKTTTTTKFLKCKIKSP